MAMHCSSMVVKILGMLAEGGAALLHLALVWKVLLVFTVVKAASRGWMLWWMTFEMNSSIDLNSQ